MRKGRTHGYSRKIAYCSVTHETDYAKTLAATYICRMIDGPINFEDSDLINCFEWSTNGTRRLMDRISKMLDETDPRSDLRTDDDLDEIKSTFERIKKNMKNDWGRRENLDGFIAEYPVFSGSINRMAADECRQKARELRSTKSEMFSRARHILRTTFGLSKDAVALCEIVAISKLYHEMERLLENTLQIYTFKNRPLLALVLDMDTPRLNACIKEMSSLGIATLDHCMELSIEDDITRLWADTPDDAESTTFSMPLKGQCLKLEDFNIEAGDIQQIKAFMTEETDLPVHILLYGPPGTGKTTFARSLARALGVRAWGIPSDGETRQGRRRASLAACLRLAAQSKGSFVVMDEAERFLDTHDNFRHSTNDKAWLNDFLERPNVRMIWIVNNIRPLDQSVRRRFAYSVEFGEIKEDARLRTWKKILRKHSCIGRIPNERLNAMVKDYPVAAAVMEGAVARAAALPTEGTDFAETLERSLASYTTLANNGRKQTKDSENEEGKSYTLKGLSFSGDAEELISKCRRIDELKRDDVEIPAGGATMLFYGPPGTGKTALAKHIADKLGRKLVVKRASDLISPYVGMSEQNVAAAFKEAEDDVLLIDEADSFLYSRETAVRSWESTLLNEFLTCLEGCRGFCICTTNREPHLDDAAMRRFSFKFGFTYSEAKQVEALYKKVLAPLAKGRRMRPETKARLLSLKHLTPGDFHTVKTRHWLDEPESLTHEMLVDALAAEQEMKHDGAKRVIGF